MGAKLLGAAGTLVTVASANCAVTYPTSSPNDLLLGCTQFVRTVTGAYSVGTPSGWTLVPGSISDNTAGSDTRYCGLYWRLRGGADTSVTWVSTQSASCFGRAEILSFQAGTFNPLAPIDNFAITYALANSTTLVCPTITTTQRDCALAFFALGNNAAGTGAYTYDWSGGSIAEQFDSGATQSTVRGQITAATDYLLEKGATGTRTATSTGAINVAGRFMASVSIAPANPGQFFPAAA